MRFNVALTLLLAVGSVRADGPVEYNRDIRPILAKKCFACHGPDSASRKAGLRLDRRDDAIKAEAFVPGQPDKSELIERITSSDPKHVMPPRKTTKTLTAEQKETLKRWIAGGAEYQPHWSFLAPKRPELPAVKNAGWVRNPIDRFILAGLEKQGLTPTAEADRRTLARRLSLDIVGLPPPVAEVEKFVADQVPDAYERYVDRLFESPHYGEHRARYWLDAARYADTSGIHFDNYREMFSYRDWVIEAFNRNQPFDQFTIDQLAGDLLPNRTLEQQVATGFNRCNITTNEGGAINEEYLVLYNRDRTETTAQVWLGLTAGCATCHDHKFDPLSQREFYELAAFFNNTTQNAMDGNIKDTPPTVVVPRLEDRDRWTKLSTELAGFRQLAEQRKTSIRPEFDKWLPTANRAEILTRVPADGLKIHAPLDEGKGPAVQIAVDGQPKSITLGAGVGWSDGHIADKTIRVEPGDTLTLPDAGDFDRDQAFSFGAWVKLPRRNIVGPVFARMDDQHDFRGWDLWLENDRFGMHFVSKWPEDAFKITGQTMLQPRQWYHLFITYDGSGKTAGVKLYLNGNPEPFRPFSDKLTGTTRTTVPLKLAQRHSTGRVEKLEVQDLRIYGRTLSGVEVAKIARTTRAAHLATKNAKARTDAERNELLDWFLVVDKDYQDLANRTAQLQNDESAMKARATVAHVMQERPGEATAFILHRGDYDKRRDQVKAGTPKALPPMSGDLPRNRLGFARWLLQPEHPLTARVTVNRYWQEIFGTGLVRSTGDFGITGELPSHPELLDWLAIDFRENGWDVTRCIKQIVTSATYRQAAVVSKDRLEKDPHNRLVSRGPRFRLDAEVIRDYALATSGLLVPKIGGPSVKPYQPEGVWEAVGMPESNTKNYRADAGESLYRRSMYTFWKRAAPPASMDVLNAPNRETCTVRRERTNTPLQALVTLNDPQFIEAARNLAQITLREGGAGDGARLDFLARRLLARPFTPVELVVVQGELGDLLGHYKNHVEDARRLTTVGESRPNAELDAPTLAAWTMLANQLLNLDEVLNK